MNELSYEGARNRGTGAPTSLSESSVVPQLKLLERRMSE